MDHLGTNWKKYEFKTFCFIEKRHFFLEMFNSLFINLNVIFSKTHVLLPGKKFQNVLIKTLFFS